MKLIIAGATGFVGSELVRQALRHPAVTSVIALARKPVSLPQSTDASKLRSVVIKQYDEYPDEVKREFSGAAACIWTVAITPSRSTVYPFEEVRRVCQASPLAGLRAMSDAEPARPFRFLFMSGMAAVRDPSRKPMFMAKYALLRGETEKLVLDLAAERGLEAGVVKPGIITDGGFVKGAFATLVKWIAGVPNTSVDDISRAILEQIVEGFEKEELTHGDLVAVAGRFGGG